MTWLSLQRRYSLVSLWMVVGIPTGWHSWTWLANLELAEQRSSRSEPRCAGRDKTGRLVQHLQEQLPSHSSFSHFHENQNSASYTSTTKRKLSRYSRMYHHYLLNLQGYCCTKQPELLKKHWVNKSGGKPLPFWLWNQSTFHVKFIYPHTQDSSEIPRVLQLVSDSPSLGFSCS